MGNLPWPNRPRSWDRSRDRERSRPADRARLRTKLVFFFLALVLLPAFLLSFGAASFIKTTVQQLLRTRGGERVDAQLRVAALTPPAVLVLGPVVHEHEDARQTHDYGSTRESRVQRAAFDDERHERIAAS